MLFRNMYIQATDGTMDLITPRGYNNPESNVFDKAFNTDIDMEEWDDWMRWEGGAPGLDPIVLQRKDSIANTVSSPENWSTDVESAGRDAISASILNNSELPFDDPPFEFDEAPRSNHGLQLESSDAFFPMATQTPQDTRRAFRGFSSLTAAEVQSLQDIAMPSRLLAQVKISESEPTSPAVTHSPSSPSPSPEPATRTRKNKKRKSIVDPEDVPTALCQSRKTGHNAIEKRYRTNLNEKINCLRQGVPSFSRHEGEDSEDGEDSKTGQQKYGKAAILMRALEYIKHLESTIQRLGSEVDLLKTRVGAFEKLAMSGSIVLNRNVSVAPSGTLLPKSETLESIQAGIFFPLILISSSSTNAFVQISNKSDLNSSRLRD
jgi:hypothetical protein